tara:strand:- start:3187 stop:3426 length:240 start_codon:yes stop_codon:yes gene_type:complete
MLYEIGLLWIGMLVGMIIEYNVAPLFKFIFRVRLFRFLASNDFEEHLKNLEDSPANMDEIEHPIGTIQQVTEWDGGHFR